MILVAVRIDFTYSISPYNNEGPPLGEPSNPRTVSHITVWGKDAPCVEKEQYLFG